MKDSYQKRLEELKDQEVILHRADASELKGKVHEVDDDGCCIAVKGDTVDTLTIVFVALKDIRGIGTFSWDYDVIS